MKLDENNTEKYIFDLKDHLGNTRVSFVADSNQQAEMVQEDHYYPFGMRLGGLSLTNEDNKFLYNSKELEDDFDLNWYHYGARYYNPQLCRWMNVDPADEFFSPYVYCGNNPILFIDPDGANSENTNIYKYKLNRGELIYKFNNDLQDVSDDTFINKMGEAPKAYHADILQVKLAITDPIKLENVKHNSLMLLSLSNRSMGGQTRSVLIKFAAEYIESWTIKKITKFFKLPEKSVKKVNELLELGEFESIVEYCLDEVTPDFHAEIRKEYENAPNSLYEKGVK